MDLTLLGLSAIANFTGIVGTGNSVKTDNNILKYALRENLISVRENETQ